MADTNLRLIVLNTNYYFNSTNSSAYTTVVDPVNQFAWFRDTLKRTAQLGQQALIVGHVPPGVYARSVFKGTETKWFYNSRNEQYIAIIREYCDTIVGQLFGHEHEDAFKLFFKSNTTISATGGQPSNETCSFLLSNPSVSPRNFTELINPSNPAVRLYTYGNYYTTRQRSEEQRRTASAAQVQQPSSAALLQNILVMYSQYYFDLKKFNSSTFNVTAENWDLEYNTADAWNITTLTAVDLGTYYNRLFNSSNDHGEMLSYLKRASAQYEEEPYTKCETAKTVCRLRQMCAISAVSFNDFNLCTSVITPFFVNWLVILTIFGAAPVLLLIVFAFAAFMGVCVFKDHKKMVSSNDTTNSGNNNGGLDGNGDIIVDATNNNGEQASLLHGNEQ